MVEERVALMKRRHEVFVHDAIVAKEIYNRIPKKCYGKNYEHAWKQFICSRASRTHIHHMPLTN